VVSPWQELIRKITVIYRYEKLRHIVWVKGRVELSGTINSELLSSNDFTHSINNEKIFFFFFSQRFQVNTQHRTSLEHLVIFTVTCIVCGFNC
jgi:hypothetical protein